MPYFKNKNINLLLIHIPKTGGTSVEEYLSNKYNIELNYKSLWSDLEEDKKKIGVNSSLQHLTFNEIYKNKDIFNIDFNYLKIITIVRNPYERIVSDLFWYKLININSNREEVFEVIKDYIKSSNYDNHNIPQYLFVTDNNKKIFKDIKIFCTNTLNYDMVDAGYKDFNLKNNSNNLEINYFNYLNNDSIELINSFYDNDFSIFKFNKIKI
jgi:hypothetical protein